MGAIQSVDRKLVEVGRAFRLSDVAMVRRILLPAVLPAYVISLRSGLGLGWMFVVAAELMGASEGLGYLLIDGQQLGKPAEIVAAIVAFAIVGKSTDWLIALAARAVPALGRMSASRPRCRSIAMLILDRVGKTYRNGVHALGGVSLEVALGEIVAVIGGSGCGKSTLLRAIGGLDPASEGSIMLDGERDHRAAREDRHHLSGAAAVALAQGRRQCRLRARRSPGAERAERASRPRSSASASPIKPRCGRANCRAARRSASPSRGRWCRGRKCCCSTSRSRRSMPSPAPICRIICSICGPMPGQL